MKYDNDSVTEDTIGTLEHAQRMVRRLEAASGNGASLCDKIDDTINGVRSAGASYEQGPAQYRNPSI